MKPTDNSLDSAWSYLSTRWPDQQEWPNITKKYWSHVKSLRQARPLAMEFARNNLKSKDARRRYFAADILGQLCNPNNNKQEEADAILITKLLVGAAYVEQDVHVTTAIARAMTYDIVKGDEALNAALHLSNSTEWNTRLYAAQTLGGLLTDNYHPQNAIDRLVELTKDTEPEVRNIATFELGSALDTWEVDTPEIREAIFARATDRHFETRAEALRCLSYFKDLRGIPLLHKRLQYCQEKGSLWRWDIEAAGNYALPEFYDVLTQIGEWYRLDDYTMSWALARCNPDPIIRKSVAELSVFDVAFKYDNPALFKEDK